MSEKVSSHFRDLLHEKYPCSATAKNEKLRARTAQQRLIKLQNQREQAWRLAQQHQQPPAVTASYYQQQSPNGSYGAAPEISPQPQQDVAGGGETPAHVDNRITSAADMAGVVSSDQQRSSLGSYSIPAGFAAEQAAPPAYPPSREEYDTFDSDMEPVRLSAIGTRGSSLYSFSGSTLLREALLEDEETQQDYNEDEDDDLEPLSLLEADGSLSMSVPLLCAISRVLSNLSVDVGDEPGSPELAESSQERRRSSALRRWSM